MYRKLHLADDSQYQEHFNNGTLHININTNSSNNDSSTQSASGDISYSSIDSMENEQDDEMSFAPTEDFRSCTSNGSADNSTGSSRPFGGSLLGGLSAKILESIRGDDGFEEGYHDFSRERSVIVMSALAFFGYLLLGTVAFSYFFEHWTPIDAMYFTVVTFTTCGYGDLAPETDNGKLFTLLFIILGITVLGGICLTVIFENVFEYYEDVVSKAKEETAEKFMRDSMMKIDKKERNLYFQQSIPSATSLHDDRPTYFDAIKALWPFLISISIGAAFIGYADGWDATTTLYFFVVTATSVGYGDVSIHTTAFTTAFSSQGIN